jgi:hypothetical protein
MTSATMPSSNCHSVFTLRPLPLEKTSLALNLIALFFSSAFSHCYIADENVNSLVRHPLAGRPKWDLDFSSFFSCLQGIFGRNAGVHSLPPDAVW